MAETVKCPQCGQPYSVETKLEGRKVRCRKCQTSFLVSLAPASDFSSFLDEEMQAASPPPSAPAEPQEVPQHARPQPAPPVSPPTQRKPRRRKQRDWGKVQRNLVMIGTMAIVMPWFQAWTSGRPFMSGGPYLQAYELGATLFGLAMYVIAYLLRPR